MMHKMRRYYLKKWTGPF